MVGWETHFFFVKMENVLKSKIEEFFRDKEYKIIDLIIRGERGTKVIEIYADNENGINIDELARINRELNETAENEIEFSGISSLIVSSPGAERSFKYLWQLKKHIGRTIEAELNSGEKTEGKLESIEETGGGIIFLEIMKKEKGKKPVPEITALNFSDIKESRVKISFSK